jgi:hypothetical protein
MWPCSVAGISGMYIYQAAARALASITMAPISIHNSLVVVFRDSGALLGTRMLVLTSSGLEVLVSMKRQTTRAECLVTMSALVAVRRAE